MENFGSMQYEEMVAEINGFLNSGSAQKWKLFFSASILLTTIQIKFVKKHNSDNTFGNTVYKMIDLHGTSAPSVYNSAFLRRQDFSRVTDPKCNNVSRQLVWQIIIGLRCFLDEADEVPFSAGHVRKDNVFDRIMKYL